MEKLNSERHGVHVTTQVLQYQQIRLESRPETQDYVEQIKAQRMNLRNTYDTYAEAKERRMAATAEIGYRDGRVDSWTMQIKRDAENECNGNRKSEYYQTLFPKPPSELLAPTGGETQKRFVKTLCEKILTDTRYAALRGKVPELETRQALLTEAEQKREACYQKESMAQTAFDTALFQAQRAYNRMFHHLSVIFESDADLVETFFRELRSPSSKEPSANTEPTPKDT